MILFNLLVIVFIYYSQHLMHMEMIEFISAVHLHIGNIVAHQYFVQIYPSLILTETLVCIIITLSSHYNQPEWILTNGAKLSLVLLKIRTDNSTTCERCSS